MDNYTDFSQLPGAGQGSPVGSNTTFNSIAAEQAGALGTMAIFNMATVHEFGNIKFEAGTEDPNKRKHLHVKWANGTSTKFWIEKNGKKDIEHIPGTTIGRDI